MYHAVFVLNEEKELRFIRDYTKKIDKEKILSFLRKSKSDLDLYIIDNEFFLICRTYKTLLFVFVVQQCDFLYVYEQIGLFIEKLEEKMQGFSEQKLFFDICNVESILDSLCFFSNIF